MDAGPGGGDAAEPYCGDGICAPSEGSSCPADCGSGSGSGGPCNNDGFCEPAMGETNTGCPSDCDYVCGNGLCESGETETSCPADCGARPFDCANVYSQAACYACFKDDAEYGLGTCDDDSDVSGGTADDCAACVGSGVFGSACGSACASGESDACAQCMAFSQSCGDGTCQQYYGETADNCAADCTFDCGSAATQSACQTCLSDDYSSSGECDSSGDAYPGSAADCAACVGSGFGAAGSACATYCAGGETADCDQCVAAQRYCGDGYCDTYYGETHTFCPSDCTAVCGDGICQTSQGETSMNCSDDCTVSCASAATELECYSCFESDFKYGAGDCYVDAPLTADDCATCVATGAFGSANACESACGSGENDACAHCMHNLGGAAFDCSDPYTLSACQTCFADDQDAGSGACDAYFDAYPGSDADCLACAGSGAFGSGCEALCGSGETADCLTCVSIVQDCGDGYCDASEGESPVECPADCTAVCGDGVCDTDQGENATNCGSDCPLATNDTCDTALALSLNTLVNGTTFGAVSDYETSGGDCPSTRGGGPDVVYSIDLTAGTPYTFTAHGTFDVVLSVVGPGDASVCDADETACVDGADSGIGNESFSYTPSTSGTYFVIVDTYSSSGAQGTFTIEVDD